MAGGHLRGPASRRAGANPATVRSRVIARSIMWTR